jgi:hypothetical protein
VLRPGRPPAASRSVMERKFSVVVVGEPTVLP